MSYNSWHIYGYGLCVSDIEDLRTEKIQALLAKAPKYQKMFRDGWKNMMFRSQQLMTTWSSIRIIVLGWQASSRKSFSRQSILIL